MVFPGAGVEAGVIDDFVCRHPPFSDMADTHYDMYAAASLRPPEDLRSSRVQGRVKFLEGRDEYRGCGMGNLAYLKTFKPGRA